LKQIKIGMQKMQVYTSFKQSRFNAQFS